MLTCNCTLCYSNPNACQKCPNNTWRDLVWTASDWDVQWVNVYDHNRYELVEKKDWKLNQLKDNLIGTKEYADHLSKEIDAKIARLAEYQKDIDTLEEQIKDLEK